MANNKMTLNVATTVNAIAALNTGVIHQNPADFAKLVDIFVQQGSQTHILHSSDIQVFANPTADFDGIERTEVTEIGGMTVANTLVGLMAAGAKFFDAIIYLSMDPTVRPKPSVHAQMKNAKSDAKYPLWNDLTVITKYIFVVYFFIVIRGHPPSSAGDYKGQPMPKFITTVLSINESAGTIGDYLASFPLNYLNPAWVRHITIEGISQEATSRFGLGVAGYRLTSVFNIITPDRYRSTKAGEPELEEESGRDPLEKKPDWLDDAIEVAQSFKSAGPCWDFHPATRNANVLSKYGNINKNTANLIILSFNKKTIERLVSTKKLAVLPQYDDSHTEIKTWGKKGKYTATSPIFTK